MPNKGLTGRSILVVDDEDVFLTSVVEGLAAEFPGVEFYTGSNGEVALGVLQERVIDLVVTDVSMPVMDGMELVAAMISQGIQVPVIMVTAFGTRAIEREAHRHGVISMIDKPIDFTFLLKICESTLRSLSHGNLGGVTLAGLLQLLQMESRSCTVRVFSEEGAGQIFIENGAVVGSVHAQESGMKALRRILSWAQPELELGPLRVSERNVEPLSLQAALLEAAWVYDEAHRDQEELVLEEQPSGPVQQETTKKTQRREPDRVKEEQTMANIEQSISQAMNIQGCMAAALVDYESGMCLGSRGQGFPIEVAAAGNTEVLRAKMRVMTELGIEGGISDILITLDTQFHLIVPMSKGSLFLYVAIDRKSGNLAMARHKLTAIEQALVV